MKIYINDADGTTCKSATVFSLDGSQLTPSLWEGKFHKNGKWSYQEGGVELENGYLLFEKRSTHINADRTLRLYHIENNVIKGEWRLPKREQITSEFSRIDYGESAERINRIWQMLFGNFNRQ